MRAVISASLAFVITVMLLLSSCGRATPPPSASEVLSAMLRTVTDTAQPLPDGVIRLSAAPADSPNRLNETFFSALYGEAARGLLAGEGTSGPAVQDAAIFLSVAPYPCELGAFRCTAGNTARELAALCRGRLDTLSRGFSGGEYGSVASGGRVAVAGNWVFLALCEDPGAVLEVARRLTG